jgi:hypothetical protein
VARLASTSNDLTIDNASEAVGIEKWKAALMTKNPERSFHPRHLRSDLLRKFICYICCELNLDELYAAFAFLSIARMASALGTKRPSDRSMEKCEGCRSKRVKVSPIKQACPQAQPGRFPVDIKFYLTGPSVCQQLEIGQKARNVIHVKTETKIAARTRGRENFPGKPRQRSDQLTASSRLPHHQPPFLYLCLLFLTIRLSLKCPFQTIPSSQRASPARLSQSRRRL